MQVPIIYTMHLLMQTGKLLHLVPHTLVLLVLVCLIPSDQLGPEAAVDGIYQGTNLELEFVVQEPNLDIVQMMLHPFQGEYVSGDVTSVDQEDYGVPGRLVCAVIGTLEAIPIDFTPAAAFSGGSATGAAGTYPTSAN